ncbi:NAD-dependent epimerase/dehydratase family protein [Chitinophaga arvensicola]|uniref:Nucleoside-diphosphate-sugar epimerase n=1 Tax=Chitinophaga arvensicola TaxID=29529 RepID=A0A1I0NPD3_9BACT|nr:NAD-dependent epimerase/dehydratase family protein [Chitinophaga arvensicola]SEW03140.1 Nucleoside-diphosphate-sugar epimerase [Chitinophaga arvensicola]
MSKNILLTGAGGFLGKIIGRTLSGDNISTLGRNSDSRYRYDLSKEIPVLNERFDIVIHAAGKAHIVPENESEALDFFNVNHQGTLHLLQALESFPPKSFILISTVAVYGKESGDLIGEDEGLEANDPYGKSKILAESAVKDWCEKHKVICTIFRLPLIAGPNPPGNLGAMVAGIKNKRYANIAGGKARKSIVLAEDIGKIIPVAAGIGGVYNLTDGYHPSFKELSQLIAIQAGVNKVLNIPAWMASLLALAGDILGSRFPVNSRKLNKIKLNLTFDDKQAREKINWNPTKVLEGFKIN